MFLSCKCDLHIFVVFEISGSKALHHESDVDSLTPHLQHFSAEFDNSVVWRSRAPHEFSDLCNLGVSFHILDSYLKQRLTRLQPPVSKRRGDNSEHGVNAQLSQHQPRSFPIPPAHPCSQPFPQG